MTKVVTIVGARPQFVKAAVVSRAMKEYDSIDEVLVHTGQHYDENMSGIFFKELQIDVPKHSLEVGSASHGLQTARMLELIEEVLKIEAPDCVLVYGDTNSTLAGALAASKMNTKLAHVEAGLRSYNRNMPEEINRVLTDHVSDLLLAPTPSSVDNLIREGIDSSMIYLVGDVMYDSALYFAKQAETRSSILAELDLRAKNYVLCTVHRADNTDHFERMEAFVNAMCRLSEVYDTVVPLHPRTKEAMASAHLHFKDSRKLHIIEPQGYLNMIWLEKNAIAIATDSGGVQKEAFFFEVPCITLRNETEWVELVELGWNKIVPLTNADSVCEQILASIHRLGRPSATFGDGNAGRKVLDALVKMMKR
jgi:UDP-GlcNAc3NAcA epimerase